MPSNEEVCKGGCWSLLNDVAIDSACVIDYVTKTRDFVSNNDAEGGVLLLTSSGDISKADGRGDTSFQSLARHVDTGELLIHKYETGSGGTTHVQNSKQDLLSSSFLSRHGMVPVQDHENPRVVLKNRPGFEIACYEVNRLWFMPLCVWSKGCDNCQKCQAVKSLTCWDGNGKLMEFVHTDNVRFGELPVPDTKVAALHTAKVKIQAADERRKERRATTSDGTSSHLGRQLILLEFGDLMQVLEDERSPSSRPSFEEENMSKVACSNSSSTQHVMALQGRADSSDMRNDTAEQDRRVQEQAKLGIKARASMPPRVPVRGGQVPLSLAHERFGHTSTRVIKATSACVDNLTLTHQNWDHCNCEVCMKNKPLRPMQSKAARTARDYEAPIQPFSKITVDFKGKMRQKSWKGYFWFMNIVCRDTDAIFPGFSSRKSEAPKLFKEFLKWAKLHSFKVKVMSSDSDSCFLSAEFRKILEEALITQRLYLRSHRGHHAERGILTTFRRANAILIHALLSPIMWADAVLASVMIHNRTCNPDHWRLENRVKTRLELCTGKKPDLKDWRTPLCTVFVVEHGTRFGHFRPRVLAGSWVNLGPSDQVAGAWRVFNTISREVRVSSHVWFLEDMSSRREALTNFDMNLFPNLKRLSNGKTKVLMTKEERLAFKLRELYCDPKTFPHESLILEDDLLVEYKSPQLSSQVPSSNVEDRGYDDWDYLIPNEADKEDVDKNTDSVEVDMNYLDVDKNTDSVEVDMNTDSVEPQEDQASLFEKEDSYHQPIENEVVTQEEQPETEDTGPPPQKDKATSRRVGIYTDNVELQEDQASLFDSDNDTEDEDLEDRVAATDEEYQELVEVRQRKLLPKLTDSEVRQAAEDNVKSTVIHDDEVEDEDGVSVQEFLKLTDSTLPRSNSDESSLDIEHQKLRRRAKSRKMSDLSKQDKTALKELLDLIPEGPHKITNREKDALRTAFLNDLDITWLVDENPKKRNSRAKFAHYWQEGRNDITAAKANGMKWADYLNDFEKGYFRIDTVVLDQNPELAAVLMDPVTTEPTDSLSKPSLVSALLDAPVFAPGTRVILRNMDQSRYRNAEYNNVSGRVRSYCDKTKRTLVDVTGLGVVWLRNINLIEDEGLRMNVPSRKPNPHPKLVALLEARQRTQDLLERSLVVKEINERIRMLEMELADPEPLSALALYDMMAEAYKTSIQKAYEVYCPKDLRSATTCKDRLEWIKSIRKEVNDLAAMKTWTVVPRSMAKQEGKNVMKSGLVFRVKADNDGFVTSYKSRFVCKGYSEVYGQDYFNVRSGVVDYSSARMLIALAAAERAELWTYDVKSAFVSTDVPKGEEFYCEAPQDIHNNELFGDMFDLPDGTRGILKCSKCLYGSKNSPRRFWQKLQNTLQKGGFSTTVQDQCVLICDRTKYGGGILKVAMWVDDLLVTTTSKADKEWFDRLMRESFDLSEDSGVEPARLYLGMKVTRDYEKQTITLSTPALIEAMVKDLEEQGHISANTIAKQHPMSGTRLEELKDKAEALDEKIYPYRSVVGICLHLSRTTRPDIALAVSELSRYVTCYGQQHVKAANWLALYLKGTADLGITFHGNLPDHLRNKMITFSDADWAGDTHARKSRSGYTIQLNLGPIEWYTKGQTITATSSCMSETIAAVEAAKAIVSSRLLLFELGYRQPGSSRLYVDNEATVLNANGTNQSKRSKHFQIRTELLRVYTDLGRLHVFKINTDLNISDLHTKPLLGTKFTEMRDIMMGIVPDLNMLHYS